MANRFVLLIIVGFVFAGPGVCPWAHAKQDTKLTPTELINRHLDSIGPADARARVHGTRLKGEFDLLVREGGTGQAQGQSVFASQGDMNLMKIVFESEDTPIWFKFDGSKASVSQFRPGRRTSLEKFLADYEVIFKEGLFGGTLSEAWPLLKIQAKNPKLEYAGVKQVGGRQLCALKYTPRKGSDLKITLFFEPESFRHVRTEYSATIYVTDQQRIAGGGGAMPQATGQRASSTRVSAFEEFSDFKEEEGLNLPHTYTFELSIQSEVKPALINWTVKLSSFLFSSPFDPAEVK
jgi:hypothetical protein